MRLSRHLRAYRKKHRLLQKQVAGLLNISREHYAQIELGKLAPSIKLLGSISKRLALDIKIRVSRGGYTFQCTPKR